jgi:hypothetical protein
MLFRSPSERNVGLESHIWPLALRSTSLPLKAKIAQQTLLNIANAELGKEVFSYFGSDN